MHIKSKPTVNGRYLAKCRQLQKEKAFEIECSKELIRERRERGLEGKREGRVRALSKRAVMNAVMTEGKEILTAAGDDYWKYLHRKYPWQNPDGVAEGTDSANGHRNRHGIVSERYTASRGWERWDKAAGGWVPVKRKKRRKKKWQGE